MGEVAGEGKNWSIAEKFVVNKGKIELTGFPSVTESHRMLKRGYRHTTSQEEILQNEILHSETEIQARTFFCSRIILINCFGT